MNPLLPPIEPIKTPVVPVVRTRKNPPYISTKLVGLLKPIPRNPFEFMRILSILFVPKRILLLDVLKIYALCPPCVSDVFSIPTIKPVLLDAFLNVNILDVFCSICNNVCGLDEPIPTFPTTIKPSVGAY